MCIRDSKIHIVSTAKILGYNLLGFSYVLFEKILAVPFMMCALKVFACGEPKANAVGETVSSGFTECWTTGHILFAIFSVFSMICFVTILAFSLLMLSISYLESPLPWADDQLLARAIVVIEKLVMCLIIIFDPDVALHLTA
eukprot:TRINITY_DN7788_c0_g1_i1.p1 TRINITY_DN7788_c0_g1~~TRINITY_DN7788_c0_g1_i1.p1  ORF type:complete len:142 (+),score=12.22 TRINITY_DN7788_c0_g1_i1:67-492(+)